MSSSLPSVVVAERAGVTSVHMNGTPPSERSCKVCHRRRYRNFELIVNTHTGETMTTCSRNTSQPCYHKLLQQTIESLQSLFDVESDLETPTDHSSNAKTSPILPW